MLKLLNFCCHGYVAIPIIEACHQQGLFTLLNGNKFCKRTWLVKELAANEGYFSVAIQALESLGWLEKNDKDAYRLTNRADRSLFNLDLTPLYAIDPESLIQKAAYARTLAEKIAKALLKRPGADLVKGAIIPPLVTGLQQLNDLLLEEDEDNFCEVIGQLDKKLASSIEKLFVQENWLTGDKRLTVAGRQILQTRQFDDVVAYRPMLHAISDLLFGAGGHHGKIIHQLKGRVSEAHESYMQDLQQEMIDIFNQFPVDKQPRAMVDVSCTDDTLLKEVYRVIREHTLRGQQLEQYPLQLIGVNHKQQAPEQTTNTSGGIKYRTLTGDINKPDDIRQALEADGMTAESDVVYILSFSSQHLTMDTKQTGDAPVVPLLAGELAHYLNEEGQLLNVLAVLSQWQRHLQTWADSIGKSHLLVLQAHTLPVHKTFEYLDRSQNFYFDTIHGFTHHYLISAEAFLMLAANAGLFNKYQVKRYPELSGFCRVSLHHFTKRDYAIRFAQEDDLVSLIQLEELCWSTQLRTSAEQILARLQQYPQGQVVLEKEGKVLGVIYSQRIVNDAVLEGYDAGNVHELHNPAGAMIQLIAVNIHPGSQNFGYGDQLLEFMLQRCSLIPGILRVVAVSLCKKYDANDKLSIAQYIQQKGSQQDPILAFHDAHGASIVKPVPNYRPLDHANQGYGVLVAYDILNRVAQSQKSESTVKQQAVVEKVTISQFLQDKVAGLLNAGITTSDFDRPVMEMGLNSVDLMALQKQIEGKFNVVLEPGFFFEYNSVNKVIDYLSAYLGAVAGAHSSHRITADNVVPPVEQDAFQQAERAGEISATDIAIIGVSCKLPGGIESADELWEVLAGAKSMISQFPSERGEWPAGTDKPGIDQGGFLHHGDTFDASFFRMSPKEVRTTDPQQRILLELTWACLEDASIVPAALKGTDTGVFIGASNCDYSRLMQAANLETQGHHAVGSSLAVLANRLSYFFDFSGPSLTIDTACSASLVALHTAVKSLQSGECAAALVGGVNFICYPELSIAYQSAGMLSPDSRCKVFDADANGYVRSEGAVVLLLKPLHKAMENNDHIHAVIKGSAVNHGGLGGGLTVPNPQKQSELYTAAWKNAGISPGDLSYLEAHGTGTSLGDPIEIQGIKAAYAKLVPAEKANVCAIGSVKSNLGHLESAAGITGLLKVVLSMQHRQLPASINYNELNPKILLRDTSFYIQNKLQDWEGKAPLLAGVSSFGSGGANAHVVVQEYVSGSREQVATGEHLFILSAASKERLLDYAEKVRDWSKKAAAVTHFTAAIYSWQTGRAAMKHRLAIKVKDWQDLQHKLGQWLANGDTTGIWTGQAGSGIELPFSGKDLEQLAVKWIAGAAIAWQELYTAEYRPKRIALPTYPFAKERYWIDVAGKSHHPAATTSVLHPLLHRNTSNLSQQCYSSVFSGDEFFISDYQLNTNGNGEPKVLPAVIYFEMARVAIEQALPLPVGPHTLVLQHTVWGNPVAVNKDQQVNIALFANGREEVDFEIYSEEEIVHCQGKVIISERVSPAVLDITHLKKQMHGGALDAAGVYAAFERMELFYGPSYQGITAIYQGQQQLLAHISLPGVVAFEEGGHVLHPGIIDSALQAGMAFMVDIAQPSAQPLQFNGFDSLHIISACTPEMFAWVRYSVDHKLDIDLCDQQGKVCVQLRGIHSHGEVSGFVAQPATEKAAVAPKQIFLASPVHKRITFNEPEIQKPTNISLTVPGAFSVAAMKQHLPGKVSITLSDTASASRRETAAAYVNLFDNGNGIYSIKMSGDNTLSVAVAEQLLHALEFVKQAASVKVLLLSGSGAVFLQGGRAAYNVAIQHALYETIASFPCPVIAVMPGDASGAGFLLGALCDFMICSEEGKYSYTDIAAGLFPTIHEYLLFSERFGEVLAKEFLYQSTTSGGKYLKEKGWSCPILPAGEVEAYAQKLALDLSGKPEEALRLLKQHLGRHLLGLVQKLTHIDAVKEENKPATNRTNVTSGSRYLKLATDAEQVLTISIHTGKETFALKDIVAGLNDVINQVNQGTSYKAIILSSDDPAFISATDEAAVLALQRLILASPVPVIAAITSNATGIGWLISQFCDACIYNEQGMYSLAGILNTPALAQPAAMIFSHRLGNYACNEILLTGKAYTGAELQRLTGAITVVGKGQVLSKAMELAAQWTQLPLAAIQSWKKECTAVINEKIKQLPVWLDTEEKVSTSLPPTPVAIALKSAVIKATVHPEGIVEVKMEDREAKNMFSDAFIAGIIEVFAHIAETPAYKVVILTGYDSYFASGGTKEMLLDIQDGKIKFTDAKIYHLAMACNIPVIAAMQGHGIGAGWSMGMFADFILFSEESHYVSPYMHYGFTPGAGATLIFPDKTGYDLARETLLTGVEYAAGELKEKGLLLPVLSRKKVLSTAFTLAKAIAQHSRSSLIAVKHQLSKHLYDQLEDTYRLELAMHEKTFVGRSETLQQIESNFYQEDTSAKVAPEKLNFQSTAQGIDVLPAIVVSLKTLLAQELHMPVNDIDEDSQFVDLGLDSIIGVTFIRKINEVYKISINATKVYSYPNLAQFSRFVKEEAEKNGTLPFPAALETPVLPGKNPQELRSASRWNTTGSQRKPVSVPGPAAPSTSPSPAIAVIGMAGQFPEAKNVEAFWQNIAGGKNCIREIDPKRWNTGKYYQEGSPAPGKTYSKWMGALEEYDLFDPLFFNISPAEAESMDPQQRLFLQTCWHAIENAGYNATTLANSKCGVFVGCGQGDYHLLSRDLQISAYGFTGGDNSILAARISYFLNLQGPCLSVDTACSSSLVAIANACDALTLGKSDLMLAGGVYIGAGSDMHVKTSQMGMLSPDGKCYSFDQRANGFVPGEGVGVVMLKRLEDAERDHDNILGVIQGWGVNQDGKTNGITAPNTAAQALLQQEVYDKYQIDPAAIQLVEAHGTGTKLGDPIEVEALVTSFKKYTQQKEYCALGSVKSNIGHCLMAAGVAGVIKLLLSLKHKQLPPTINFEQLNEHISLEDSPFYVNTQLKNWELKGAAVRKAAISSFGFSGTNAHLVIAEYPATLTTNTVIPESLQLSDCIIPLSARTEAQLKQKVMDLLDAIRKEQRSIDLLEMAYTLQVGRVAMEHRVGFIAGSTNQLAEKLQAYVEGKQQINDIFAGKAKRNEDTISLFAQDTDLQATVDKWIQQKKFSNLISLWVKGYELDWNKLYGHFKPRRISLPVYPFAKERYWIEEEAITHFSPAALLHPLLHSNISILHQQTYSSVFKGEESFLHRSPENGVTMLPELTSLEMVRVAVEHSLPSQPGERIIELHHVVWGEQMIVTQQTAFTIALYENDKGSIDYEISSKVDNGAIIHHQGTAQFSSASLSAKMNIDQLKGQMKKDEMNTVHPEIKDIYQGDTQLLAHLHLSAATAVSQSGFVLSPAMMEHTLRMADFFLHRQQRSVPLSTGSIQITAACTSDMFVWIRFSKNYSPANETVSLDIDLYDRQGNICIQMKELSLAASDQISVPVFATEDAGSPNLDHAQEATATLFFREYWQDQPCANTASLAGDQPTVIFIDKDLREKLATGHQLATAIMVEQADSYLRVTPQLYRCRANHPNDINNVLHCVTIEANKPVHIVYTWAKDQGETGIHLLFDLFKVIKSFASYVSRVTLIGHYHPSSMDTCWDYSWIGFERSLKLLLPNISLSLLYTDTASCTVDQLLDASQHNGVWWYKEGTRHLLSLQSCKLHKTTTEPVLKQNGSYLITGGGGSLGLKFARYLAENYHANLMLVGRRSINADMEAHIKALKALGAREVYYRAVDISNSDALLSLKSTLPFTLSGIIHAAGVESAEPFYRRSTADINKVLHPKSIGSILLDEAFDQPSLDFICYFSSVSAFLGDFGSCDYAIASRFQMAYSRYREQQGRNGKTVVINWPLWQEGGMGTGDKEQTSFYLKSSGQEPLQTLDGIALWHDIMRTDMIQTLVMLGKPTRVEQVLQRLYQTVPPSMANSMPAQTSGIVRKGWKPQYEGIALKECVTSDLKQLVSALTKINQNKLSNTENLTDYGFDSISLSELAKRLTNHFGWVITPAIFFSATTIGKLSEYFLQEHTAHLEHFYRSDKAGAMNNLKKIITTTLNPLKPRQAFANDREVSAARSQEPIAIIGMSGRFPQAKTVDQLWTLLAAGKHAITEIPANRWDWRHYFNAPGDTNNKITTNKGGFIHGVDEFDPLFFEISPREAEQMDPAERLLLTEAYKAIEDARISPQAIRGGNVGVFVGMEEGQYDQVTGRQGITTSGNAMISSRLSYFLDLHGPAIATNTACSSGLVALHQAAASLRQGECKTAIVAGISLLLSPESYVMMSEAGMLSADGHCHSFSKNANGIGVGESVVVLVLKPLSAAIAEGDSIYGTIQASGINFDGKTNGVTAPNGDRQAELIEKVYTDFRIDTNDLSYIVTHGTGTRLGDPVEINALVKAFKKLHGNQPFPADKQGHCALTSCKSNIGHTLAASGLVSVVNLLKAMQHRQIPASLHCEEENDYFTWDNSPFFINKKTCEWNREQGKPYLGAVSSFGRSGTNAHIVIAEYQAPVENKPSIPVTTPGDKVMILLSARTKVQLQQRARDLFHYISSPSQEAVDLHDLAYSLQVCREEFEVRLGFLISSVTQLAEKLQAYLEGAEDMEDTWQDKVKRNEEDISIINDDDDMKEAIDKWITRRKLSKLLEFWVKGLVIDWDKFYQSNKPKRIGVPVYPFAQDRYWVDATEKDRFRVVENTRHTVLNDNPFAAATLETTTPTDQLWDHASYLAKWEEQAALPLTTAVTGKTVLIVCSGDAGKFDEEIITYYTQHTDGRILLIRVADKTVQVSDNEWLCGIHDPEGFQACLQNMDGIDTLYFLSMPAQDSVALLTEVVQDHESQEIQFLRLVKFLKQSHKIKDKVESYVLTMDTRSVNDAPNQFSGSGITGLAYSLAQGNYQFRVRNLDLSSADLKTAADRTALLHAILREPPSDRGELFKLQSGKRYRQTLFPLTWDTGSGAAIRQQGVYLIVGGSGTIGKIITRHLIEKYAATVIWVGRSAATSEKVHAALQVFESFPQQLRYIQADVTNLDSMQQALVTVKQQYLTIHGAVFAGMVFDFENSLDQTTETEFRSIFDLKARGSQVFYEVLKKEPLDFMCYFSSGQAYSFSGAAKLSAYASGITYADSFVHSISRQSDFPVGIINWGFWKSSLGAIAANNDGVSTGNFDALEDADGCSCFEQFVKELRQGRIHQVLCMKASSPIKTLMNCNNDEHISLVAVATASSVSLLANSIEIPHRKIEQLKHTEEKSELERWFIQLLFCQVNKLVTSAGQANALKVSGLHQSCKISGKYIPWWNTCLDLLRQHNFIQWKDDIISDWKAADTDGVWEKWQVEKEKYLQDPHHKARVALVNDCLEKLPEILQGKTLATDVIFPDSSMDKVEGIYKNNMLSDTFNKIVANAVVAYVQQRLVADPKARLKILEIGAGTGGTSAIVFSTLQPFKAAIEKYSYTDLSKAFFFHAEKNYVPDNPYIQCQRLDIEQPLAGQGIEPGTYDLVIATNVLHATRDIRQTLRNAKAILHQNGYLVLNELSTAAVFNHVTFGLLNGWWLFKDSDIRMPGSPGLYPGSWQQVLEEEGFFDVSFPASAAHGLGQQIILAQSDGVVRQKMSLKKNEHVAPVVTGSTAAPAVKQQPTGAAAKYSQNIPAYIRMKILHCLSETLKISGERIDPDIAFSDYGIDSILGVSFINSINGALSISLNTAIIFEHSSVNRLSKHVQANYQSQIAPAIDKPLVSNEAVATARVLPQHPSVFTDKMNTQKTETKPSDIAVVGISGMFPKAENINEFWNNLIQGIDGVDELPHHYLDQKNYYSAKKQPGKTRCKWGGVIEDRDCFDPLFFNISPKEAESMNPHQRLVLQEGWKALENAGYNPKDLSGSQTGIYIGAEPTGYTGDSFTGYSDAIIASRLSYILNLNGPSFVVNTGCSSSAVALHLACESLRNKETDLALAGGVNACLEQHMLIRLDEIEMLSPSGRCFTFDQAADGTIMSEGIGIVVLKRLEDAIASGDQIYGLISGSGINQDGASNGITAPNGAAQEKLIVDVYNKFSIDPENISYVEAHGTGTKLGDPVETNALVRAFRSFTAQKDFCIVGSAKSYIGHTAAAAGVIGLIKVLLSLEHHQLPKLLNFTTINALVEFHDSPFSINTTVSAWKPLKDTPRMAAINSFGHSGTNAHLVVKEYMPTSGKRRNPVATVNDGIMIPLSAKTAAQLQQKAADLLGFIRAQEAEAKTIDLMDMAYTLQVGREPMEERVGFMVYSVAALAEKLQAYMNGERNIENTWVGQGPRNKEMHALFSKETDFREIIDKWISSHKLSSLLELWVKGLDLDWHKLYDAIQPNRIHLPSYPFAKERYWLNTAKHRELATSAGIVSGVIHPLLHQNTSDLSQQCYTTIFNGEEFFLNDHQVNGHKVLPAVAYLEMAREAINQASPGYDASFILELHNTVWLKPVVVAAHQQVSIALFESEATDGAVKKIDFEIYCKEQDRGEETIHCQGQATFTKQVLPAILDVAQLKGQMQHGQLAPHTIYHSFKKMGLDYGPAHQGITMVYMGEHQLLAHLNLPKVVAAGQHDFTLHPGMMDAALQVCIGLMVDVEHLPSQPLLPFALESVRIIAACTREMFVWARYAPGSRPGDKFIKIDLDLCDPDGNVCVQMHGFSSRTLEEKTGFTPQEITDDRSYDDGFYSNVIDKVLNNEISAEEAAELN
jgi:acyl transferase domain-containing protein/acyl carrier protein